MFRCFGNDTTKECTAAQTALEETEACLSLPESLEQVAWNVGLSSRLAFLMTLWYDQQQLSSSMFLTVLQLRWFSLW